MSELANKLKNATSSRTGNGHSGKYLMDNVLESLPDEEDRAELKKALEDYDPSRGQFRVSGRAMVNILQEAGIQVAQSTVQDYRKRNRLREKAVTKHGIT